MSNQKWQDGGVKIENMKTEVRSQESEWGRPRAMLASSQGCRRPGAEGIQSTETIDIPKAGGDGKSRAGKRVDLGKGRQWLRKRTGFSHLVTTLTRLFPHNSTQVVDFPRLSAVRDFGEAMKWIATDETHMKTPMRRILSRRQGGWSGVQPHLRCPDCRSVRLYADLFAYRRTFQPILKKSIFSVVVVTDLDTQPVVAKIGAFVSGGFWV